MRQGAVIFAKLTAPQVDHVIDPFYRCAAHIGSELAVAKHCEPLFQTQLKPVATGDPVAGPIVKILVRDDRLDAFKIIVGRGFWAGQHARRIKDVQAFVFHRPHVEIINGNDVENIKIILAIIDLFIPTHRGFESAHTKAAFALIAWADPDIKRNLCP